MKIGILTYHAACNFGANLQALSTFNYLQNLGHTPVFIDWMPKELSTHYLRSTPQAQYLAHKQFRDEKLILTKPCISDIDIIKIIEEEKIEAIIVGSDAVMQHHPLISRIIFPSRRFITISKMGEDRMCPNPFWGSFMPLLPSKIPIAYMSASSQNSAFRSMTPNERRTAAKLLTQYNYISTRDDWTSTMVNWITKGKIIPEVTPDPVFAFNNNVRNQFTEVEIRRKFGIDGKYYLLSFHNSSTVSRAWLESFKNKAEAQGIKCIAMAFPNGINFEHPFTKIIDVPISPLEWYGLIKYSNGYIGHNMHPIVVSLHNSVPCFSFDNYGVERFKLLVNDESSKIFHIMKKFGVLENRISCKGKFYKAPSPDYVIDKLNSFNKERVSEIANQYLSLYKKMMNDILNSFTFNN